MSGVKVVAPRWQPNQYYGLGNNSDNVTYGFAATTGSPPLFARPLLKHLPPLMSQQQHPVGSSSERQIQTALCAIKQYPTLKIGRAAAIYRVSRKTLSNRHAGRLPRADCWPKSKNLTKLKEEVVVKHIL
jgi:hypothetical protein